jgi:hypothetical protein
MALPTPDAPKNAFDEGADQSAERQKQALTQLLASQGSAGAQLLKNRGEDAGALAAQARAQYGDAAAPVKNLYNTFERDAQQRQNAQTEEMARIQAANSTYMDQMKAAIPLHKQESDDYMNALRMEFEDRQRQREAEEAERAAAASSRAGVQAQLTNLQKAQEKVSIEMQMAQEQFKKTAWGEKTPELAQAAGMTGSPRTIEQAATAVGMDPEAAKRRWVTKEQSQFREADDTIEQTLTDTLNDALKNNMRWDQVVMAAQQFANFMGMDYSVNIQPWLAQYSPLWGVADAEWIQAAPKQTYGYDPSKVSNAAYANASASAAAPVAAPKAAAAPRSTLASSWPTPPTYG